MAYFRPGDRIELIQTTDVHTELRPGDQGVVTRFDLERQMVYVDWDGGSKLSMCLDAGDQLRVTRSVATIQDSVETEPLGLHGTEVGRPPREAIQDVGAGLQRLDKTRLDSEALASLAWIADCVERRVCLERVEGSLSSVGCIDGLMVDGGEAALGYTDIRSVFLQVQLVPSGDRVLWSVGDLIDAQQQECLFELA